MCRAGTATHNPICALELLNSYTLPRPHELPINIPVKNTSTPPTPTRNAACKNGVSIYLWRIQLIVPSSTTTTIIATVIATWKLEIKNGSVGPNPPAVVIPPITSPRIHGEPLPVNEPSSESASANPMEIPAPTDAAIPTKNASHVLCVAYAAAKSGASVDTDPSINPASPG